MKNKVLFLCLFPILVCAQNSRQILDFNRDWRFCNQEDLGTDSNHSPTEKGYAFSNWQTVCLPHTAKMEPLVVVEPWVGVSWYQKEFSADPNWKSKKVFIDFGAVMQKTEVWLNNKLLLTHTGGYLPFSIDISTYLDFEKPNQLIVRTDNADNPEVPPGKPIKGLDFCYFSGIYRNVTLSVYNRLHITNAVGSASGGVKVWYPLVSSQAATVAVSTNLQNELDTRKEITLTYKLVDRSGKTVAERTTSKQQVEAFGQCHVVDSLSVLNPLLWHPDHPNLYTLQVEVLEKGSVVDDLSTKIGIRAFEIVGGKMCINAEPIQLVGTNRHQEYPYLGNALSDNAQYRDALKIKQAGFNIVRLSHYPQSPAFMDACDELGILTIDAIPGWQFVGNEAFKQHSYQDARELIRRDRNHASVAMWELSLNESPMPDSFMVQMVKIAQKESTETDLITCGWINKHYDVWIPARQHGKAPVYWKKYKGTTPLFTGEYGDWEYFAQDAGLNQAGYAGLKSNERTSRQLRGDGEKRLLQQATNFQEAHNDNLRNPHLGDANWLMFDYNRGYSPDIESSGIMDIFRLPKFSYYFYQTQVKAGKPIVKIASYWNPDSDFKNLKVYSNCDEVALYLNNTLIERKAGAKTSISDQLPCPPVVFDLKGFEAGTLKAVGFVKNKAVAHDVVSTAGKAYRMELSYDSSGKPLKADGADAVFVYAMVRDKNGNVINDCNMPITFEVEGVGRIIGQNPIAAEAGIATVLLQSGCVKKGYVKVTAKADGVKVGSLIIRL